MVQTYNPRQKSLLVTTTIIFLISFLITSSLSSVPYAEEDDFRHHQEALRILQESSSPASSVNSLSSEGRHRFFAGELISHEPQDEEEEENIHEQHIRFNLGLKNNIISAERLPGIRNIKCSADGVYLHLNAEVNPILNKSDNNLIAEQEVLVANNKIWQCSLPSFKSEEADNNPQTVIPDNVLYRKIQSKGLHFYLNNNHNNNNNNNNNNSINNMDHVFFFITTPISLTELFSHGNLRLLRFPSKNPNPSSLSSSDSHVSPSPNEATYSTDFQEEWQLLKFNYDPDSHSAAQQNISVVRGDTVLLCEDCYAHMDAGIEVEIDIDLFLGIKNFKIRMFGDSALHLQYLAKSTMKDHWRHKLDSMYFGSLDFHLSIIPVSIKLSGQLDVEIDVRDKASISDNFLLTAHAQIGTQYTHDWGEFRDISRVSSPHHDPIKPHFEIDQPSSIAFSIIPSIIVKFEHCLPLEMSLQPSVIIDIFDKSSRAHFHIDDTKNDHHDHSCVGSGYNTQWQLSSQITIKKLHFLKWSIGASILPVTVSFPLVSKRPLKCAFCSGCVHTESFNFDIEDQHNSRVLANRIHIRKMTRESGHTDDDEWVVVNGVSAVDYCSFRTCSEENCGGDACTIYDKTMTINPFDYLHIQLRNKHSTWYGTHKFRTDQLWTIEDIGKPQNFLRYGCTGKNNDRHYSLDMYIKPMIKPVNRYQTYSKLSLDTRFTIPTNEKYVSHQVMLNVSTPTVLLSLPWHNSWNNFQEKRKLYPNETYTLKPPLTFSLENGDASLILISTHSVPQGKTFSHHQFLQNEVLRFKPRFDLVDDNFLVINITTSFAKPQISALFLENDKDNDTSTGTPILSSNSVFSSFEIQEKGMPTIQVAAPSNNELGELRVEMNRVQNLKYQKLETIKKGNQAAKISNSAAQEVIFYSPDHSRISVLFSDQIKSISQETKTIESNLIQIENYLDHNENAVINDPDSWKWMNMRITSPFSELLRLSFIETIHAGTPLVFNVTDSFAIHRYRVPKEPIQLKLYFRPSKDPSNVKFLLQDGKKSLLHGRRFKEFEKYREGKHWTVLELKTSKLTQKDLYISTLYERESIQVKILAIEVVQMDAKHQQIKEIGISSAGYRVFNISIPQEFSHGLSLKCEPHRHSDPDLLASAEDLTTRHMTKKSSVIKTRLGRDQLGLSLQDGDNMLQQGYFFLAVFSYNATWFAFDINALDSPRGSMMLSNEISSNHLSDRTLTTDSSHSVRARDIRNHRIKLIISLYGQFQFDGTLYYRNKSKETLTQQLRSSSNNEEKGWNAQMLPALKKIDFEHELLLNEEQQTMSILLPQVKDLDPSENEKIYLNTQNNILTPSYSYKIEGITILSDNYDSSSGSQSFNPIDSFSSSSSPFPHDQSSKASTLAISIITLIVNGISLCFWVIINE